MFRRVAFLLSLFTFCLLLTHISARPAAAQKQLDFGDVKVGQSKEMEVSYTVGGATGIVPYDCREGMKVTAYRIEGADKNDFQVIKQDLIGTHRPGVKHTAVIRFTPSHTNAEVAHLVIDSQPVNPRCKGITVPCDLFGNRIKLTQKPKVEFFSKVLTEAFKTDLANTR